MNMLPQQALGHHDVHQEGLSLPQTLHLEILKVIIIPGVNNNNNNNS